MLLMAIALLLPQSQNLPAVSPGLCLATGAQMTKITDIVRGRLEDDAKAEREGREHKYDAAQRQQMMTTLEGDSRDAAKVQRRFSSARSTDAERQQINDMEVSDMVAYLRLCVAD